MKSGFFHGSTIESTNQAPPPLIPRCGACGLFKECNSPKMPAYGNGNKKILIIGEAPEQIEDTEGKPLLGKSGQFLRDTLEELGIDLDEDCIRTDSIICKPSKQRQPTTLEIEHCSPNIRKIIKTTSPVCIILLGNSAIESVLTPLWKDNPGSIIKWNGFTIPSQTLNAWICPTWHPSFLLQGDQSNDIHKTYFKKHLQKAVQLDHQPWEEIPNWKDEIDLVYDSKEAAHKIYQSLDKYKEAAVAFDYETNMLKPDGEDASIISCAMSFGTEKPEYTIAYPWIGNAIKATSAVLCAPIAKIASNMKFEDRWTRTHLGHRVRNWKWDTMLAAHWMDNRRGITSVKFQAFVHLGISPWNPHIEKYLKSDSTREPNQITQEIEIRDLLIYNGLDSLIEFHVAIKQMQQTGYKRPW